MSPLKVWYSLFDKLPLNDFNVISKFRYELLYFNHSSLYKVLTLFSWSTRVAAWIAGVYAQRRKMASRNILQLYVDRGMHPWFAAYIFDIALDVHAWSIDTCQIKVSCWPGIDFRFDRRQARPLYYNRSSTFSLV